MMNYSDTEFKKLIGRYDTHIFAYMEEVGASEGDKTIVNVLFNRTETTEPAVAISGSGAHTDLKKYKGTRTYEDLRELYTKNIEFEEFTQSEQFGRKLLDDNKIWELENRSASMMRAYYRTCENFAASIFNNISSSSFTKDGESYTWTLCADGQPISDASHTTVSGNCTTLDNEGSDTLDGDNFESAVAEMSEYQDDSGNQGNYFSDTLMVPFRLRKQALELIGSEGKPTVSNNDYNIYEGAIKLIVWNRLTKGSTATNYPWSVHDSQARMENLFWFDRIMPEVTDQRDFETMSWKVGIYTRFAAGCYDWRFGYFNIPA
jgi:hypothetical protein